MNEIDALSSTKYKKLHSLGAGTFSEVFLVQQIESGEIFVCKEVLLTGLDESTVIQLHTEAKVLEALKHPHIIEIKEFYRTESQKLVFILEYAARGDLHVWLKSLIEPVDEFLARRSFIRVDSSALSGSQVCT